MATKLRILIFLFMLPVVAEGHSEMFFPKLFSLAELQTTGFAMVNPEPFAASVTLYLVGAGGFTTAPTTSFRIQAQSQVARLGSELFPNASGGGWIYGVTDAESMPAFWLNYDEGVTFMDGADAAQLESIGADQVIPFVAGDSELNVINPNGIVTPINIRLYGNNGELASVSRELPVAGGLQSQVSVLFPSVDMAQARYIRIRTPGAPIASTVVIRGFLVPTESAIVNGTNVAPKAEFTVPHVVNGRITGANYTTVIGVTNLSTAGQTVTITFTPDNGSPIEVLRTISANGALRETAQSLFDLSPEFQSGWVRVRGTAVTGFAVYADSVAGGMAFTPAIQAQSRFFFSHIADGPPQWQTGLALLNGSGATANVEVVAFTPSGTAVGGAAFVLDSGRKVANVIHEWIPATRGMNGGFVYVRTTNNVPIYGIELFYTEDLRVLSNVPPGKAP